MGRMAFVKEPRCIAFGKGYQPPVDEPYNKIFFTLSLPSYETDTLQLTGSRVHIHGLFEDEGLKIVNVGEAIGTVLDNLFIKKGDFFLLNDIDKPINGVYARLNSKKIAEMLRQFAFDSENPNDIGWLTYFCVGFDEYSREHTSYIPLQNIVGYNVKKDMARSRVSKWMLVGWPPTEAYVEFFDRKSKEMKMGRPRKDIAPDRTYRSNDLLNVSTIVTRKPSPFTVEEVRRKSSQYGKPLTQVTLVSGSDAKYALVDRATFG